MAEEVCASLSSTVSNRIVEDCCWSDFDLRLWLHPLLVLMLMLMLWWIEDEDDATWTWCTRCTEDGTDDVENASTNDPLLSRRAPNAKMAAAESGAGRDGFIFGMVMYRDASARFIMSIVYRLSYG